MSSEMISISNQIQANRGVLSSKYHVKRIGIFGSIVRNEQTQGSDIDTLIELSEPLSLFQYFALQDFLESILNNKVDLVTIESLKPNIGRNILNEVVFI